MTERDGVFDALTVFQVAVDRHLGDMPGYHRLLHWLLGEPVYTHRIPDVADDCHERLVQAWPVLARLDVASLASRLSGAKGDEARMACCLGWVEDERMRLGLPARMAVPSPAGEAEASDR